MSLVQVIQAFRRAGTRPSNRQRGPSKGGSTWTSRLVSDGASTCRFAALQSRAGRAGPMACGDWGELAASRSEVLALEGLLQRPRPIRNPTSVVCLAGLQRK